MPLFGFRGNKEKKNATPEPLPKISVKKEKVTKVAPKVEAKKETKKAFQVISGKFSSNTDVIKKPLITEKSGQLSAFHVYTFLISENANKVTVAKAVKELYKVSPIKVNIINLPAKKVFIRGKFGTVSPKRKALVTLREGDKIDFV